MVWLEAIVSLTTRVAWSWWQFARRDVIFVNPSPCVLCCFLMDVESCLCDFFAIIFTSVFFRPWTIQPKMERKKWRLSSLNCYCARWSMNLSNCGSRPQGPCFFCFFFGILQTTLKGWAGSSFQNWFSQWHQWNKSISHPTCWGNCLMESFCFTAWQLSSNWFVIIISADRCRVQWFCLETCAGFGSPQRKRSFAHASF